MDTQTTPPPVDESFGAVGADVLDSRAPAEGSGHRGAGDPGGPGGPGDPAEPGGPGGPDQSGPGDGAVPGAETVRPRELVRPARGRILGGVAAGLARYFDVDVLLVRIVLVVLAVFSGVGIVAYLVAWALVPGERSGDLAPGPDGAYDAPHGGRRHRVLLVVVGVLAGLALLDLGASGPWWPHWGEGAAPGFWLAFGALALLVVLVARGRADSTALRLRRLLVALAITAIALATVTIAAVLTAEALTGVPLRGGIGDSEWQPAGAAQVAPAYRLAVGRLDVDLRGVSFPAGTTRVAASVGIGQVQIEVPPGPTVSIVAHSGVGDVWVFGDDHGGLGATRSFVVTGADPGSRLVLDVQAGLGQVRVVR